MPDIGRKSNNLKLELKFKERSIDITPMKDIYLPVGKTAAFQFEMVESLQK